jgi:hypothetical protein
MGIPPNRIQVLSLVSADCSYPYNWEIGPVNIYYGDPIRLRFIITNLSTDDLDSTLTITSRDLNGSYPFRLDLGGWVDLSIESIIPTQIGIYSIGYQAEDQTGTIKIIVGSVPNGVIAVVLEVSGDGTNYMPADYFGNPIFGGGKKIYYRGRITNFGGGNLTSLNYFFIVGPDNHVGTINLNLSTNEEIELGPFEFNSLSAGNYTINLLVFGVIKFGCSTQIQSAGDWATFRIKINNNLTVELTAIGHDEADLTHSSGIIRIGNTNPDQFQVQLETELVVYSDFDYKTPLTTPYQVEVNPGGLTLYYLGPIVPTIEVGIQWNSNTYCTPDSTASISVPLVMDTTGK